MNWEPEQVAGELRKELSGPAPVARTAVAEVMSKGLRRRRIRQAGSVALSLVVVAGAGVMAVALGGKDAVTNQPAISTTTSARPPVPLGWNPAALPTHTPYGTFTPASTAPPPAGFPKLEIPQCSAGDTASSMNTGSVPVPAEFTERLVDSLRSESTSATKIGALRERHIPKDSLQYRPNSESWDYWVDISDQGGMGSLWIQGGTFTGTPTEAADKQAYLTGNCVPPKRNVQPDGTVVQVYSMAASEPYQTLSQTLMMYRPGGRLYKLTTYSFGSVDLRFDEHRPSLMERIGPGRKALPLTEAQLAVVGIAVAEIG
jgi:hypothetical protein